jgi:hypothetical protein
VIGVDLNEQSLSVLATPSISIVAADATDTTALEKIFADVGDINILVNCIGCVPHGTLLDCSLEDWRESFRINVDTMYATIRLALPGMIRQRGKHHQYWFGFGPEGNPEPRGIFGDQRGRRCHHEVGCQRPYPAGGSVQRDLPHQRNYALTRRMYKLRSGPVEMRRLFTRAIRSAGLVVQRRSRPWPLTCPATRVFVTWFRPPHRRRRRCLNLSR